MSEQAAMTVEQAIEFAREWQKGLTVYPGAMGWRVVCMVLADEVEKITAFYAAIMDERAELRNKLVAMDAENDELRRRLAEFTNPKLTNCWRCSDAYEVKLDECPHCGAANANVNWRLAKDQIQIEGGA